MFIPGINPPPILATITDIEAAVRNAFMAGANMGRDFAMTPGPREAGALRSAAETYAKRFGG